MGPPPCPPPPLGWSAGPPSFPPIPTTHPPGGGYVLSAISFSPPSSFFRLGSPPSPPLLRNWNPSERFAQAWLFSARGVGPASPGCHPHVAGMLGPMISSRGCQYPTTLNTKGEFQTNKRGVRPLAVATQGESYPTYAAVQFDPLPIWVGYNSRAIVWGVVKLFYMLSAPVLPFSGTGRGMPAYLGLNISPVVAGRTLSGGQLP